MYGTFQSDVDIPGKPDRRYGPLPPKRSGDDNDDDDCYSEGCYERAVVSY